VNATSIEINAVGSSEIADNAVGSGEIADNAVGSGEIADSAVGSTEIATDAVGQSEIAPNSVGTSELQDNAVTSDKIFSKAVTADKIADNTITNLQIGPDAVGSGELSDNAVIRARIQNGAVNSDKLADSSVTAAKIANGQVTTAKIADGAVTNAKIADGAITNAKTDGFFIRTIGQSSGITVTRSTSAAIIGLSFGTGSQEVPRGNHTHTVNVGGPLEGVIIRTTSGPSSSTLKVKKDIQPYKPAEIKNLLKLEPKTYRYKRSERAYHQALNKELMHGYVVEELLDLGFPEPVGYDKDGNPATLDYGLMSLLVLELVKVQQTEIDFLKEEVLRLKDAK
jgi:hypothetical protein